MIIELGRQCDGRGFPISNIKRKIGRQGDHLDRIFS